MIWKEKQMTTEALAVALAVIALWGGVLWVIGIDAHAKNSPKKEKV